MSQLLFKARFLQEMQQCLSTKKTNIQTNKKNYFRWHSLCGKCSDDLGKTNKQKKKKTLFVAQSLQEMQQYLRKKNNHFKCLDKEQQPSVAQPQSEMQQCLRKKQSLLVV